LKSATNIRVLSVPNKNYDYGGYSVVLKKHIDIDRYDYFLFVNSSVRGPFLPPHLEFRRPWFDFFIDKFNSGVGAVGASINILNSDSNHAKIYREIFGGCGNLPHVQTPVFALSQQSLDYLFSINFFNIDSNWSRQEVISRYEIRLSQCLLEAGWDIKCLLPEYSRFDYRVELDFELVPGGDVLKPGSYFGRSVHPYEIMFIKTGRGLWPISYLNTLASSMSNASSLSDLRLFEKLSGEDIKDNYLWFVPKTSFFRRILRKCRKVMGILRSL
jgi:hypothetical protein